MMRILFFLFLLLVFATKVSAQPQSLGIFGNWGAFRSVEGCHAVARPHQGTNRGQPFVAIAYWPRREARGQIHVRLSEAKRDGSAIFLRVDGRSFQLRGAGLDAWAADAMADSEIRSAIRTGIDMIVETRAVDGRRIRHHYRLQGAATAMDAAAVACLN